MKGRAPLLRGLEEVIGLQFFFLKWLITGLEPTTYIHLWVEGTCHYLRLMK